MRACRSRLAKASARLRLRMACPPPVPADASIRKATHAISPKTLLLLRRSPDLYHQIELPSLFFAIGRRCWRATDMAFRFISLGFARRECQIDRSLRAVSA